jgi:hypothetical protein
VSWVLESVKEVFVRRYMTLNDFGVLMSAELNIPVENIEASKIISMWNFFRV